MTDAELLKHAREKAWKEASFYAKGLITLGQLPEIRIGIAADSQIPFCFLVNNYNDSQDTGTAFMFYNPVNNSVPAPEV